MTINMNGLAEAKMKWFSAKVFLAMLAGIVLFILLGSGGSRQAAWELTLFAITPATIVVTMLAISSAWPSEFGGNDWMPDTRPWRERTYVSGQAWVSIALALFPTDLLLLLLL